MTEEVPSFQGSGVPKTTYKKDSEAVATPLIDPQFLKEKESERKRSYSVGDVFLAASYVSLLLEFSASGYTFWCTSHPQSDLTIHRVTIAYFALCLLLSSVFLANSAVELRYLRARRKKLPAREKRIKYATEYMTAISSALWVTVTALTIVMAEGIHNAPLQYTSLVISLMAPFTCSIAAFLRVYDTYLSYRQEKDAIEAMDTSGAQTATLAQRAAADGRAKSHFVRAFLFGIVAAKMALYFVVHVWKEYLLVGNTHKYFYITEKAFWICKIALGTLFIILAVVERVLKNATKLDLAEGQEISLADQQLPVSAGMSPHANDDTPQLISNEQGEAVSITPCSQKTLIIR